MLLSMVGMIHETRAKMPVHAPCIFTRCVFSPRPITLRFRVLQDIAVCAYFILLTHTSTALDQGQHPEPSEDH